MPRRNHKSRARQWGVAAVETIIVTPLLLFLMLGISELGRALSQYNTLTKAARDGARYLAENSLFGSTTTILITPNDRSAAENLVVYGNTTGAGAPLLPGLAISDVSVSCLGGGLVCPGVEHIVVSASYTYQPILGAVLPTFGYGGAGFPLGIPLTTTVTMRTL